MFVRLQRIIDKVRRPIQDYCLHSDGKTVITNKVGLSHVSTAQLIQELDLVNMLEEGHEAETQSNRLDADYLQTILLSQEQQAELYSSILGIE